MSRTICFFTGTRAEYGLLKPLMKLVDELPGATLKTLVTGTHLSESAGATWHEIATDGFTIDEKVEILIDSGSEESIATSIGLGVMGFTHSMKRLEPDMLVILGDRFEAIAAAIAATICKIPIVHIHGGELTLGAMDDAFRHAITKMSYLHFTSNEAYRTRVIQLGEDPSRVYNVGSLGVENALSMELYGRREVERILGLDAGRPYFLVTFHPATLELQSPEVQLNSLLEALESFLDYTIVFTGANADVGGSGLNRLLAEYAKEHKGRYHFSMSLGSKLYLSTAREAEVVIGNSSSGIIEVPSLRTPTVDIGIRQKGRIRSDSVISCEAETQSIKIAIEEAISPAFRARVSNSKNPYDQPNTSSRIIEKLMSCDITMPSYKKFYDL